MVENFSFLQENWRNVADEGNGLSEVEENDSKDTLVCDDDAHEAVVSVTVTSSEAYWS